MSYSEVIDPLTGAASTTVVQRDVDGAFIPADPENSAWQGYLAWLAEGNAATVAEPSIDAVIAAVDAEYQAKFAQLRSDIATAMLNDGTGMDSAIAALRTKYVSTWNDYGDALVAAIGG